MKEQVERRKEKQKLKLEGLGCGDFMITMLEKKRTMKKKIKNILDDLQCLQVDDVFDEEDGSKKWKFICEINMQQN